MDLYEAIIARRDTRHFTSEPVPTEVLHRTLRAALHAPSVGLSQPWRFIDISLMDRRRLLENFREQREQAETEIQTADRLGKHKGLKLEGLAEAPVLLAVYCEYPDPAAYTIGIIGNHRALEWSCACAIQNLWLALTAEGFGAGWVTILDLQKLAQGLNLPQHWEPLGIICIGRPATNYGGRPMLESEQWKNPETSFEHFYRVWE